MSPSDIAIAFLVILSATFTILYYRIISFRARLADLFWVLVLRFVQALRPSHRAMSTHGEEGDLSAEPLMLESLEAATGHESSSRPPILENTEPAAESNSTLEPGEGIEDTREQGLNDLSSGSDASSPRSDLSSVNSGTSSRSTVEPSHRPRRVVYLRVSVPTDMREAAIDSLITRFRDYPGVEEASIILDTRT
ncbi:hypothetical protein N7456_002480 [Penicillium angulare]|uniref:Uncharacterized protein n=1 Tax=Penicillium angulare TaxID=116970 RepID=A0A9W9G8D7_9EURO|nr:hypothetical protein N7456_002480 [Penicillium angulare]